MHQLEIAWEIMVNIFESFLFVFLLANRLHFRKSLKAGVLSGGLFSALLISVLNFTASSDKVTMCILLIYNVVFSVYISDSKLFEKIAWGSSCILIVAIADNAAFGIAAAFTDSPLKDFFILSPVRMYVSCIYLAIFAFQVFILSHLKKKDFVLPKRFQIALLLLICLGAFVTEQILSMIILVKSRFADSYLADSLQIIGCLLLVLVIGFLGFIKHLGTVSLQNEKLRRTSVEFELEKKHYDTMDAAISALREWKHDYKNHLQVMHGMAREQNCGELMHYIAGLESSVNQSMQLIFTGNRILDAILSARLMELQKLKIQFTYEIHLTAVLPLDEIRFTSLIGNLLDNAMEACLKLDAGGAPYIKFVIKPYHDMLYIGMENSSDGIYSYGSDGLLKSTKSGENHGFGLKKIQKNVTAVGGFCKLYPEAEAFKAVIMLPAFCQEGNDGNEDQGRNRRR